MTDHAPDVADPLPCAQTVEQRHPCAQTVEQLLAVDTDHQLGDSLPDLLPVLMREMVAEIEEALAAFGGAQRFRIRDSGAEVYSRLHVQTADVASVEGF